MECENGSMQDALRDVNEQSILEIKSLFFHTNWNVSFKSPPCYSLLGMLEYCNLKI